MTSPTAQERTMVENENNAADNVPRAARGRVDPWGTLRDQQGRLRVPLDRPEGADLGGAPDADGPDDLPPDADDECRWPLGEDADLGGDHDHEDAEDLDEDEAAGGRLSLEQVVALDAVAGMAAALCGAPFCAPVVEAALRLGEAALATTPGHAGDRALQRVRRLVFAHRLVERLLERACQRVIDCGAVPAGFEELAAAFQAVHNPGEGTAGAGVVLEAVHRRIPSVGALADRVAGELALVADLTPAPSAEALRVAAELPWLGSDVALHWMALGDDDLGLLDVVLDAVATTGRTGCTEEVHRATLLAAAPRLLARAPAALTVLGEDSVKHAHLFGAWATQLLFQLAVARKRAGVAPDPERASAAAASDGQATSTEPA
jgi:hypothetical protein